MAKSSNVNKFITLSEKYFLFSLEYSKSFTSLI